MYLSQQYNGKKWVFEMSSGEEDQVSNLTRVQIAQVLGYFKKELEFERAQGMGKKKIKFKLLYKL